MSEDDALVITRTFDAPIEKVWAAWTEPEQIMKWWGPKDFTAPTIKIDFRVGGKYLYCMRGKIVPGAPDENYWSTGTYKEIVPHERIVATDNFSDADGNIIKASDYGLPGDWPDEVIVTFSFKDLGNGKTELTLRHEGIPGGEMGENTRAGWNQSLDKLAASL